MSPAYGFAAMGLVVGLVGCDPGSGGTGTGGSTSTGGSAGSGGNAGSAGSNGGSIGSGGRGGAGGTTPTGGSGGTTPTGGSGGVIIGGGAGGGTSSGGAGGTTPTGGSGGVIIGGGAGGGTNSGGSGGVTETGGSGGSTGTTTSTSTSTSTSTDTVTGPGITDPPAVASGSRLRARMRDGGNGAVAFAGWQDTQLNTPCTFFKGEDGVVRCIPDADPRAVIRFSDSNCTQPVIALTCGSTATYVPVKDGPAGCEQNSEPRKVYQVGAAINSNAATYALMGSTCTVKLPDSNVQIHEANAVLPDTFLAANVEDELHGDRLKLQVLTGDDDSREVRYIRDTQVNDVACSPQWTGPGRRQCLPTSDLLGALFYADAQCQQPLLVRMQSVPGCAAAGYGLQQGGSACTTVMEAVNVGASVVPQAIFQGNGSACMPTPIVPTFWSFYNQGADVPASSFMNLARQELGTGRLRVPIDTTTEGIPVSPAKEFRDSNRNLDCAVRKFSDGSLRCVPANVATVKFYRDAQCTLPVVTLVQDPTCSVPASTEMVISAPPVAPGCAADVIQEVHSVGPAYAGSLVYRKTSSSCVSMSAASIDAYDLGPAIGNDVFPAVTEQLH